MLGRRMIAWVEAHRAGLFKRDSLWKNVLAGIIVGIVALPLAMAFAIASGAKPEQGLYTAIVAGLATSVLGGTRVQICDLSSVATIGTAFGGIPRALPELHWPALTLAQVLALFGPAFTIAMLGAIESLLTAVVADGMTGTRHASNQELIGQGAANILSRLFGGFAATGAVARTFFFGAAEKLEATLERVQLHIQTVVIRLGRVPFMDATGTQTLSEIIERSQRRRIRVILCGIQPRLRATLERAEILRIVGNDNICANLIEVSQRIGGTVREGPRAPA